MLTVDLNDALKRLPELVEAAARGEDVIIARGDGADVRLVPVIATPRPPRVGGGLRGRLVVPSDFDEPIPDFEPYT